MRSEYDEYRFELATRLFLRAMVQHLGGYGSTSGIRKRLKVRKA